MLKCDNCKNKFTEVKDCFGTKFCFKCYSRQLEEENAKIKADILFGLPDRYQAEIQKVTNGKIFTWDILHTYLKIYIKHLKAGKHE